MAVKLFGPWVHGLNKGGLEDIWQERRLKATEGRYGGVAVRAHKGSFAELAAKLGWGGATYANTAFVEFMTSVNAEPSGNPKAPAFWQWTLSDGTYLPIVINRVSYGSGLPVILPASR